MSATDTNLRIRFRIWLFVMETPTGGEWPGKPGDAFDFTVATMTVATNLTRGEMPNTPAHKVKKRCLNETHVLEIEIGVTSMVSMSGV